ncbi:hypothetical protein LOZ51_004483 [Ophidiomyces ophidiicola]|nr:hypothetical protein LOZ55_002520 [Ophidiomyces ophidiicola]KAI1991893.1 hypothetical protein LOZ51_004483 [Ophidiomyces ophidiicola]KAI1993029.1 hypothetical protein LOZ54_001527 [Ophidiomyces ophidiicola]
MAAVEGVMGPHEQKAFHPFFQKHRNSPLPDHPSCPNASSCPNDSTTTKTSGSASSLTSDGCSAQKHENEEHDRRKRRKTAHINPQIADSGASDPPIPLTSGSRILQIPTCAPSTSSSNIPKDECQKRYSFREATVNYTPIDYRQGRLLMDNVDEISQKKKKILQLNPNGKLLSSPVQQAQMQEHVNDKETTMKRVRKKREQGVVPMSRLAVMKYGSGESSRQHIGCAIFEIMHGHTTYTLFKRRMARASLLQEHSKPTHPFFLIKKPVKKADDIEAPVAPSISDHSGFLTNSQAKPMPESPLLHAGSIMSTKTKSRRNTLCPRKPNTPTEPIWPSLGMVHVSESWIQPEIRSGKQNLFGRKKAKGLAAIVPGSESVIDELSLSIPRCRRGSSSTPTQLLLRQPQKLLEPGYTLRDLTVSRLSRSPIENALDDSNGLHPAISCLLSTISTAKSCFEKGTYESLPWVQKYSPKTASAVLQDTIEPLVLRDWLQNLTVTAVSTDTNKADLKSSKTPKPEVSKKKKRKAANDLDDFIVSSGDEELDVNNPAEDDEDELAGAVTVSRPSTLPSKFPKLATGRKPCSNTILLSGPPGCGKTAAVYAIAGELDFEVFEVNAGSRRSAKDVAERVGDMTQNHLVQILNQLNNDMDTTSSRGPGGHPKPKQTSKKNFFGQKPLKVDQHTAFASEYQKPKTNQRQSLILLEEVDLLFGEDKQFWNGVFTLIAQSKRPIVMTCNDETLLPMDELSFHAILRFRPPPPSLVTNYLCVLCASESHILDPKAILQLYTTLGNDLRATIMQLDYWCQMAIGSKISGLDWIVDRPWTTRSDTRPDTSRIISKGTYIGGMGWLCRDIIMDKADRVENKTRLVTEVLEHWQMPVVDLIEGGCIQACAGSSNIALLEQANYMSDMKSALDLLEFRTRGDFLQEKFDPSLPPISDKYRFDYTEGARLLQADSQADYSRLSNRISTTFGVLLEDFFSALSTEEYEESLLERIMHKPRLSDSQKSPVSFFSQAFQPFLDCYTTVAHRPLSFEHGIPVIFEDIAPYIRFIATLDLRAEQQRSNLASQFANGPKRMRTTRASRAALEGGPIKREKWFSSKVNALQVLATGGSSWEDILELHLQRLAADIEVHRAEELGQGNINSTTADEE